MHSTRLRKLVGVKRISFYALLSSIIGMRIIQRGIGSTLSIKKIRNYGLNVTLINNGTVGWAKERSDMPTRFGSDELILVGTSLIAPLPTLRFIFILRSVYRVARREKAILARFRLQLMFFLINFVGIHQIPSEALPISPKFLCCDCLGMTGGVT